MVLHNRQALDKVIFCCRMFLVGLDESWGISNLAWSNIPQPFLRNNVTKTSIDQIGPFFSDNSWVIKSRAHMACTIMRVGIEEDGNICSLPNIEPVKADQI